MQVKELECATFDAYQVHHKMIGHHYCFSSSIGHPRLDSVKWLVYEDMRQHPGHQCCIIGHSRQCKSCWEIINISSKLYGCLTYDTFT